MTASEGVKKTRCWSCRHEIDAAFGVKMDGSAPKPGNWSVCAECTAPLIFNEKIEPIKPNELDWAVLTPEQKGELARVQNIIRDCHRNGRRTQ